MPANNPEEICQRFKHYMGTGDLEALLGLYDPEAVFLNRSGEGPQGLREELAALADAKTRFDFSLKQVIQSGEIALMHTEWKVRTPEPMVVYAIEVARRQPDHTWRWLIGDPFTVGKQTSSRSSL